MAAMDVCCDSNMVGNGSVSTIDIRAIVPWGGAMMSMLSNMDTIVFMDTDTDGVMPRMEGRFGACCASSVAKGGCIACWDITSHIEPQMWQSVDCCTEWVDGQTYIWHSVLRAHHSLRLDQILAFSVPQLCIVAWHFPLQEACT